MRNRSDVRHALNKPVQKLLRLTLTNDHKYIIAVGGRGWRRTVNIDNLKWRNRFRYIICKGTALSAVWVEVEVESSVDKRQANERTQISVERGRIPRKHDGKLSNLFGTPH